MDLEACIRYLEGKVKYADIRVENISSFSMVLRDGVMSEICGGIESGASVRALGKCWGFASANGFFHLKDICDEAVECSTVEGEKTGVAESDVYNEKYEIRERRDPEEVGVDEKKEIVTDAYSIVKDFRDVKSVTVSYSECIRRKIYANTEGCMIECRIPSASFSIRVRCRDGSLIQEASERIGRVGGIWEIEERYAEASMSAAERASALLRARAPKPGSYVVIMDPKLSGVFMHEAVGHAMEADHVITGQSILRDKIGERIGSHLLTVFDDPTVGGAFGFYKYDDEGIKAGRTNVIKRGVLVGYLHSRETAFHLSSRPTGNARAEEFSELPIVRMSNLVIEEGDMEFEEMADVSYGIYACGMRGGEVDTTKGEFQFAAEEGYVIRNGEIQDRIRNLALGGRTLEVLSLIDGVGKSSKHSIGYCGKDGQLVQVSEISPHLRVKKIRIGGTYD